MNADGTDQRRLTDSPGAENFPDWSPDGQHIAYCVDQSEIRVVGVDGTGLVHLVDDGGWNLIVAVEDFQPVAGFPVPWDDAVFPQMDCPITSECASP